MQTPPGWNPRRAMQIFEEAKEARRQKHLAKLAERKSDREAGKRLAKGMSADPTGYPSLKPDWVEPPVMPLKLRNRR